MSIVFKDCVFVDRHGNKLPMYGPGGNFHAFNLYREYTQYPTESTIPEHSYYLLEKKWFYKGAFYTKPLKDTDPYVKEFKTALLLMGVS